jgi:maleate isomerase
MPTLLDKRIGLLVPSSNTVMEVDFYRNLASVATVHTGRMFLEETTPEGENRMLDDFCFPAAQDLATARPDVIVFGCTSAGALRGAAQDAELCQQISDQTGSPVVSTMRSVNEAIARRKARRVGVITPYTDELNRKIKLSLEEAGTEVVAIHGLGMTENFTIAKVPPSEIVDFAARSFPAKDIDLLFVSCTNFRAIDARAALEKKLDLAVLTSNLAALEGTLGALNIPTDFLPVP